MISDARENVIMQGKMHGIDLYPERLIDLVICLDRVPADLADCPDRISLS